MAPGSVADPAVVGPVFSPDPKDQDPDEKDSDGKDSDEKDSDQEDSDQEDSTPDLSLGTRESTAPPTSGAAAGLSPVLHRAPQVTKRTLSPRAPPL